MLGSAGLGKTFEQDHLAELERAGGFEVTTERLAVLGPTPESLKSQLDVLAAAATPQSAYFLDALDEVMVPVRTAGLIVERWVTEGLSQSRPHLRLSCRSAVWPPRVQKAIESVYGENACAFAILRPLTKKDVLRVAAARGLNGADFVRALDAAGVRTLSEQPLTLELLLKIYETHGALPERRGDLFRRGMEQLASERRERTRDGTSVDVPTAHVLEAAERVACFCLLSGRDMVDLGESPSLTGLAAREIAGLPGGDRPLGTTLLDALCRSGLCAGHGPDRFRFAHRQFAEYLAGRRLAELLPHQARALLAAAGGWQAGVAGPLRESAAFAATHSAGIAAWICECDPEVIGQSDVADEALRRQATLNLLEKFRKHELTDSQIGRDGIDVSGFQYRGAESDLRAVLRERQEGCQDVIECAIELIEDWNLTSMSDDLASLMLDPAAPLQNRRSAGYTLVEIGSPEARRRLLPLIAGDSHDRSLDLKGLTLLCNWPDQLSVPELLAALTLLPKSNVVGPYNWFLHKLAADGFDVRGYSRRALQCARSLVGPDGELSSTIDVIRRIAIGSLAELDVPGVADALADLILDTAEVYAKSVLTPPHHDSGEENGAAPAPPILHSKPLMVRRRLIESLAARTTAERDLWWAARHTPGLLAVEDFPWLIRRAVDPAVPMTQRANYAEFASMLPWRDSRAGVEAWLGARETEPVASRLSYPLAIELDSDAANNARSRFDEMKRSERPHERKPLRPPPHERVERVLDLSETKDPRYFLNLCQELTLEENSEHYGFSRLLAETPGWTAACEATRTRIVQAAKRLLVEPSDEPERADSRPLNSILPGYMPAILLVCAQDSAWVDDRPTEWWQTWAWYVLRELRPRMSGEPEEPKIGLLRCLHARVPEAVRANIVRLARSAEPETHNLLTSLLDAHQEIDDDALDEQLCEELARGGVPDDRVSTVGLFTLARSADQAWDACVSLLNPDQVAARVDRAVYAAVTLLRVQAREAWPRVFELLQRRPDVAQRVLGDFAHGGRGLARHVDREEPGGLTTLSPAQLGQLVALLLENFPPETDPQYNGAHFASPEESARRMRDGLITWLGDQKDIESVEALRALEREYSTRYSWLRRPRARAERAYRLNSWQPVAPSVVAKVLAEQSARVLGSGTDALDGVVAAVDDYQRRLKSDSPSEIDDLWNQPRGAVPTPKDEERASDKICVAIRDYFRDYAVTANREVQVYRRKSAKSLGGAPGSEVDVLCEVPAAGAAVDVPIKIPIEVKLAHNREAQTGLRDQLVERYMRELGTDLGVYVVVWMGRDVAAVRRPAWNSVDDARAVIEQQATELIAAADLPMHVRCIVIDASLPLATNHR